MPRSAPVLAEHIDICAVLWHAAAADTPALKVSEIHELVVQRCKRLGKEPPAPSTLAGYLRSLVDWKYLKPVQIEEHLQTKKLEPLPVRVRAIVRGAVPPPRSPNTGYQAVAKPGEVLAPVFRALVDAYPPAQRREALLVLARIMDLSQADLESVEKLVHEIQ